MGKLLWLDDEPLHIERHIIELKMHGHEVVSVFDVDSAIEVLKIEKFDLLVTDMQMPHGTAFGEFETEDGRRTGAYFCQYVRLHFPALPIVVLSAYSTSIYDQKFLFRTGIEFVYKLDISFGHMTELVERFPSFTPDVKAIDLVELKPGMFGLKVDLKKFITFIKGKFDSEIKQ